MINMTIGDPYENPTGFCVTVDSDVYIGDGGFLARLFVSLDGRTQISLNTYQFLGGGFRKLTLEEYLQRRMEQ